MYKRIMSLQIVIFFNSSFIISLLILSKPSSDEQANKTRVKESRRK